MEENLARERVNATNVFGSPLVCRSIRHKDNGSCVEFVVENRNFRFGRWLACFLVVAIASHVYNLYSQHDTFLMIGVSLGLLLAIWGLLHFKVKTESLLVISSLGLQVTVTYLSGRKVATFLENNAIKGIVINEVISKQCIVSYLTVITNSQQRIIPLYQSTLPRLDFIKDIYATLDSTFFKGEALPEN